MFAVSNFWSCYIYLLASAVKQQNFNTTWDMKALESHYT